MRATGHRGSDYRCGVTTAFLADGAGAIQYAHSRWEALTRYAGDGTLAIDNNSPSAPCAASLLPARTSCSLAPKPAGSAPPFSIRAGERQAQWPQHPEAYLADVIDCMASGHPINRLGELLPWNWRRQPAKMTA